MRSLLTFAFAVCFMPFALSIDTPKKAKTDLELMEGTWVWDDEFKQTNFVPPSPLVRVVVKGKKLTIERETNGKLSKEEFEVKLHADKTPKQIDFEVYDPRVEGPVVKRLGIYEMDKESQKLHFFMSYTNGISKPESRPESFEKEDGNNQFHFYLKRAK